MVSTTADASDLSLYLQCLFAPNLVSWLMLGLKKKRGQLSWIKKHIVISALYYRGIFQWTVQRIERNFKTTMWNSTQNILSICWKMLIIERRRFKNSLMSPNSTSLYTRGVCHASRVRRTFAVETHENFQNDRKNLSPITHGFDISWGLVVRRLTDGNRGRGN